MSEQSQPELSPLAASFAEHVRAFHRSLPAEEQVLLEQVFALAEHAKLQPDTQGHMLDAFLKIATVRGELPGTSSSDAEAKFFRSLGALPPNPLA